MRPKDLDECDRLLDALSAEMAEARRHVEAAERMVPRVRALVAVHRAARALPSDLLIAELTRLDAAGVYARNWSENDIIIRARLRRLLAPTWWERVVDVWRGRV